MMPELSDEQKAWLKWLFTPNEVVTPLSPAQQAAREKGRRDMRAKLQFWKTHGRWPRKGEKLTEPPEEPDTALGVLNVTDPEDL